MGAKKFNPSEKAAIIALALGEDLAPAVLSQLGPDESMKIARNLKTLGRLELKEIDEVLVEFLSLLNSKGPKVLDTEAFLAGLQKKGDSRTREFLENARSGEYRMRVFDRTKPDILYRIIAKEVPQTLALIFSHAPSDFGAEMLKHFQEPMRITILLRMAKLREVDPDFVREIDEQLLSEVDKLGLSGHQKIGGIKKVAAILNALNQESQPLLSKLSERQPDLAASIEQEMFTFEDLLKVDDKGIQELVKTVKREVLLLSLRGADIKLVQKFAAGMSERSAKMFREDLEALGAQKKNDVLDARRLLLDQARTLLEEGRIELNQRSSEYI